MKGLELSMLFQALLAVIVIGVMMLGTYSFVQRGEFDVIKPIKEFFGFLVGGGDNYKVAKASATALTDAINAVCDDKADFSKDRYSDKTAVGVNCEKDNKGKTVCTVKNFALPQKVADLAGIVKTSSDPDYLMYYQTFPEGEANWDSLTNNLRYLALIPGVGGLKSGVKVGIKAGTKIIVGAVERDAAEEVGEGALEEAAKNLAKTEVRAASEAVGQTTLREFSTDEVEKETIGQRAKYFLAKDNLVSISKKNLEGIGKATLEGLSGKTGLVTIAGVGLLTASEIAGAAQSKYTIDPKLISQDDTTKTYNNFVALKRNALFADPYISLSSSCKDDYLQLERNWDTTKTKFYLASPCYADVEIQKGNCYCSNVEKKDGTPQFVYYEPQIEEYNIREKQCAEYCTEFVNNIAPDDTNLGKKCPKWAFDSEAVPKEKTFCKIDKKTIICDVNGKNCKESLADSIITEDSTLKQGVQKDSSCDGKTLTKALVSDTCAEWTTPQCKDNKYSLVENAKALCPDRYAKAKIGDTWKDACCWSKGDVIPSTCNIRVESFYKEDDTCTRIVDFKKTYNPNGVPVMAEDGSISYTKECKQKLWKSSYNEVDCVQTTLSSRKDLASGGNNYCYGAPWWLGAVSGVGLGAGMTVGCSALAATGIGAPLAVACYGGEAFLGLKLYDWINWPNNPLL